MPAPSTSDDFLELVRKSGVVEEKRLSACLDKLRAGGTALPPPGKIAGLLVRDGVLTRFQAEQLLQGRWRRFTIGKYKVLEQIASGGMGSVYLCEHKFMRRRAAVKVLPKGRANDASALERFYREARAVAALDHPNIVRAYDIDQEENLHFLVMEYVDGSSLQDVVKKSGPLDYSRAAHYIGQAALGLQHAHDVAGLVHRDIKPGNLIVDRSGTVKILDMGLARFFHDQDDLLTQKYDENVLGTADYLAPEQALDSHGVDIRADIYSLGATFYYCLTGKTPFSDGTVAQKLIWHQTRQPKPLRSFRQDVPEGLVAVIGKMMAKEPHDRYQQPIDVAEALASWTQANIAPPTEAEMPQLSPAAQASPSDVNVVPTSPVPGKNQAARTGKAWQIQQESPRPAPVAAAPAATPSSNGSSSLPAAAAAQVEKETAPQHEPLAPTILAPVDTAPSAEGGDFVFSPSPSPTPQMEEESIPWENLAADTKDHSKEQDTVPGPKKGSSSKLRAGKRRMSEAERRRLLWAAGGACAAGVLILAIVLWLAFFGDSAKPGKVDSTLPAPARLIVSQAGKENTFRTIQEAVARAKPFDHIVLADTTITEQITLIDARNLTIEPADGVSVVWRCPDKPTNKQLLYVSQCEGLQIQGITFDGRDKV
ncbi:MAG TPA: serine/threonine-protein kinase, partial [Gemmataceae bacterium]|nr:serine/threonine-protein kinase [Gemmataceae bacterium]